MTEEQLWHWLRWVVLLVPAAAIVGCGGDGNCRQPDARAVPSDPATNAALLSMSVGGQLPSELCARWCSSAGPVRLPDAQSEVSAPDATDATADAIESDGDSDAQSDSAVFDAGTSDAPSDAAPVISPAIYFGSCVPSGAGSASVLLCRPLVGCGGGRRPEGFIASNDAVDRDTGAWWAAQYELEAASIPAFERLLAELRALGAPASLCDRVARAVDDERRHAQTTAKFAAQQGSPVQTPEVPPGALRPLFAVARENVVEGCVRETFGAMLLAHQALHAQERSVREALAVMAREEASHAVLAFALAEWADTQLTEDARELLRVERERAVAELFTQIQSDPPEVLSPLGLPSALQMRRWLEEASKTLWSQPRTSLA